MAKSAKKSTKSSPKRPSKSKPQPVRWTDQPDEHDYPAAADYLSLVAAPQLVEGLVAALRSAPEQHRKAKDLLRSARLDILPRENLHVAADLAKVAKNQPLSPILIVAGDLTRGAPAQIADGFHRVCASYYIDENTDIPCRIVSAATEPTAG